MSIAADYLWLERDFPDLEEAYCVTLVNNRTPDEILRLLDGEPHPSLTGVTAIVDAAFDLLEASSSTRQLIAMVRVGTWTLVIEPNGYLGVTEDVALRVSAGTTWVSHFVNINGVDSFLWAENQVCRLAFEPMFPDVRYGSSPDVLLLAMQRIGFHFGAEERDADLSASAAFALAEEITGVLLTADLVQCATFTCGSVPSC